MNSRFFVSSDFSSSSVLSLFTPHRKDERILRTLLCFTRNSKEKQLLMLCSMPDAARAKVLHLVRTQLPILFQASRQTEWYLAPKAASK